MRHCGPAAAGGLLSDPQTQEVAVEIDGELLTPQEFERRKRAAVDGLYATFAAMRNEWVQHRAASGVEQRWRAASKLYLGSGPDGASTLEQTLRDGPAPNSRPGQVRRSKIVVNIVRPKVDQAVARMCEILLPVDDRNWAIRPSPVPETADRVGNFSQTIDPSTGQPTGLDADAEAQGLLQAVKESADRMQDAIDDELTECNYNGQSRQGLEDGVRLGTCVLKGPYPTRHVDRAWRSGAAGAPAQLTVKSSVRPASTRVDPWNVFFDPSCGNDHQRGSGVWERRSVTRKELRQLAGIKGYDSSVIKEVLLEQPRRVRVADSRIQYEVAADKSYELWEYHGQIEPEEMTVLSSRVGDPIEDVHDCVLVMVNDRIISTMPSWVPDGSLPYDLWCWRKADDSPFGYGLPDELAHQQSVVTAAWRQVMDNAGFSAGGQVVMKRNRLIPANGVWTLEPMKIWFAKEEEKTVEDAFKIFEFASHSEELLGIAQAAMNFADIESSMPQIMGGNMQKGGGSAVPETMGGMIMLYNNANAVLRQRVKLYDDNITKPHITRYYDFLMATSPDDRIKGDFDVDARGSTALVERDIQNQAMMNLTAITSNPRYAPHLKEREELKAILKAFKLTPDDLMKTEDQVKKDLANAPPQQDPRIASAQLNLQATREDLADRKEQRQVDTQLAMSDNDFRNRQLEYNRQREQAEFTIAQTDSEIARSGIILREQNKAQLTREQIQAKERLNLLNIESKHQIFNAEASLRMRTGQGI